MSDVRNWASRLDEAATNLTTVLPLTTDGLADIATAYRVQDALVKCRRDRGERLVGGKLGLTSKAKQIAMGVDRPLYGMVTSGMLRSSGSRLSLKELIHPRVEPEIAFVLGEPLEGPDVTVADVLAATRYLCPALDVIDSRYEGFSFKHLDAIADNASSAAFALGDDLVEPHGDLALTGCVLEVDGQVVESATGAAVMGHPAAAVAFMANQLVSVGRRLEAGWVVLSGGLTAPVPLRSGSTIAATISGLGTVTLSAE
ncbi:MULTISPECIES: 2-keto-4-pentenoate hydratase [Rhodococcus]|uniref:Fumarylacetoacetate hydrolase family protein n=1 Tax=Rhodococcus oxybenzonivorans TaxID=1990687 RepID=A0AAE5A6D7_9NOCA|nr:MULTISPECIES: fumarylacetoacetate hydrolase family protein [Rhodococcus]MDV7241804.1 fumarylacetoacetate hydrolase family protein [Rhodococcus oxybenzonivorans]MDV7265431.1 fumarylacetoacetate hydrolase family protein [Rhodococcus oxybenzonivorans]MDV7273662.1 fumarylacetoacetate hydrolase family protein [Rhodococcus oxybenzonivorans]MDV7334086.1 fumarylacetoacetate hydrolase family protein [Rhodococcus oxybenzonivorans]MDV7343505.1 fumarylacetoacetate hydrolase family protein [Rhodococcus 